MIQKTIKPVYTTADKVEHTSLEAAIQHELETLFIATLPDELKEKAADFAAALVVDAEKVADILTTKPNSRPSARKVNRKKRTSSAADGEAGKSQQAHPATAP